MVSKIEDGAPISGGGGVSMKRWLILIAGISSSAQGAPTYLACSVDQEGVPLAVEVVADEASQRATISLPSGRVVTRSALFSPTEVKVLDEMSTWVVDRVHLGFKRIVVIGEKTWIDSGRCQVSPAPAKRAF